MVRRATRAVKKGGKAVMKEEGGKAVTNEEDNKAMMKAKATKENWYDDSDEN